MASISLLNSINLYVSYGTKCILYTILVHLYNRNVVDGKLLKFH